MGSTEVHFLPLGVVSDFRQIRETYDQKELEALADRIPVTISEEDGVAHFGLVNPPTINKFTDRSKLQQYIDDYVEYYEGEVPPVDIDEMPFYEGAWYVRINGHRRERAIELKCRQLGINREDVIISYTFKHAYSFEDAMREQYIENTSSPIKPVEDARAILRHRNFRMKHGENYSSASLSEYFGFSRDKINDALRFTSMPEDIQAFVNGAITYSAIVALAKLREAYAGSLKLKLTLDDDQSVAEVAEQKMRTYFESIVLKRLKDKSSKVIVATIEAKIKEVKGEAAYQTDELFFFDTQEEEQRAVKETRRELGSLAATTIVYLVNQGTLSSEMRRLLRDVLAEEDLRAQLPIDNI